jgi:polyhydroxyalkanoate synthesis regulator phasin
MSNFFEKSIDLGLGLFALSREKIDALVEDLVKRGEVSKTDARQVAGDLVKRGEEQRGELKHFIRDEVAEALGHVNIAAKSETLTKDEIRQLVREEIQLALREQAAAVPSETDPTT